MTVLHRLRERGLPQPVTRETLTLLGVPDGNAPRTLQALKLLRLVAEDGALEPAAERLRKATTDEYPQLLAEIVQEAYAPVFGLIDPETATEVRISDAFRQYEPQAQRDRMVNLFMALAQEAGLMSMRSRSVQPRESANANRRRAGKPSRAPKTAAQTISPVSIPSAESVPQPALASTASPASTSPTTMFPVTEEDIGLLTDEEFHDLWKSLGVVARKRARASQERARLADLRMADPTEEGPGEE
jgi:hypothetical protein